VDVRVRLSAVTPSASSIRRMDFLSSKRLRG
jgi:hypothetical protein